MTADVSYLVSFQAMGTIEAVNPKLAAAEPLPCTAKRNRRLMLINCSFVTTERIFGGIENRR